MRKICALIFVMLFLMAATDAFAVDVTTTTTQRSRLFMLYQYNAYGIGVYSNQRSSTETITTNNGTTQTSVTNRVSESEWLGGSLKVKRVTNDPTYASTSTSTDGSRSATLFNTVYNYDAQGRLSGASGTTTTTGADGSGNEFSSATTENYFVRRGEAVLWQTITNGVQKGEGGLVLNRSIATNSYNYDVIGGAYSLMREVSCEVSTGDNANTGNNSTINKTTAYTRNMTTGVCIGISQCLTPGTNSVMQTRNANGGSENYKMISYLATPGFDAKTGFYIAGESWVWDPV